MRWLPEANRPITFAVHGDEAAAYAKAYPDCGIMVLSDHCRKHTGLVRKEILETVRAPFFFVDDDIRITLKDATSIEGVFDTLQKHIRGGASMAGLGQQLFSNNVMTGFIDGDFSAIRNRFVATVYGINPPDFDDCPLEQLPVYEDMALVYHAVQRGGGTITSYCATHSNVSPPTGGCNSWRDPQITIDSLKKLVELYPDICSIRPTDKTTHSQYIGIGLRTSWSKLKKLK
jgi:hypothetical protein